MIPHFDIPGIDWSNPHVLQVFEFFSEKYELKNKQNVELNKQNVELNKLVVELKDENKELKERILQIEGKVTQIQETKSDSNKKNVRSYNARNFKDYPRTKRASTYKTYVPYENECATSNTVTVSKIADLKFCPVHGTPLSEYSNSYSRTTEDVMLNGVWQKTNWDTFRRYCTKCRKQHSAAIDNVLPHEHFGINIMAQIYMLRSVVSSFETIQKIILMMYDRFIHISTIEGLYNSVSDKCRPLYDDILSNIKHNKSIRGDHTGWFLNGQQYYTMVLASKDTILYHLAPTKARMTIEAILQDYDGITISDSDSSWNSVGELWQKCLLHYLRDMHRTLDENNSDEFKIFYMELRRILKRAIKLGKKYKDSIVPEKLIQRLEKRLFRLTNSTYSDPDCKRYIKRLKREGSHLLTFLRHDIEYHNNTSERALRLFAVMRKMLYGSRSERGLETTETMATIYATCQLRRVNPYHFIIDYLNGRINSIPKADRPQCVINDSDKPNSNPDCITVTA